MTNKELYLRYLQQARIDHIRWINNIKLLLSGIEADEKSIALNPAESEFGKWYYTKAILLSNGPGKTTIDQIETLYISIHDIYMKIYPIYFGKKTKSIFGELFGKRTNISIHEMEYAQHYYEEIVSLSDKLKNKLQTFETYANALPEDKYAGMFLMTENRMEQTVGSDLSSDENDNKLYHYGARSRG